MFYFFFSSRRRHTRLQGDWSSDVCSSDLEAVDPATPAVPAADHASHDDAVADGDEETIAVLAPDEPRQLLERVGHARDRAGAPPEGEHRLALFDPARSDRDLRSHRALPTTDICAASGALVSYGQAMGPMAITRDFTLHAKYRREERLILLSGIQALVRLPLDQHRADRRRGLNTATLISGYRGSPLGGFDLTLERNSDLLPEHHVVFI